LTPDDYVTAQGFGADLRRLAGGWQAVCRSDEVAGPGSQKAVRAATTPVLLARGEDGALNAVSNVCRHRGLILVQDVAQASAIRCPYHLWAYGLDGRLAAAPFMDGADLSGCDLPRYGVCEWGGWVFVNLDGQAAPLGPLLAPLEAAIRPDSLATWKVGFRLSFQHVWNWKVMVENFGESYHHIGAHLGTLQPLWPGGRSNADASTADWIELRHSTHAAAGTFTVWVVFPTFMLALSDPGPSAYWYLMTPLGPDRIDLEIVGLFPADKAADAAAMEASKAQLLAIHLEDIPMCERVQAGLAAPDAVLGPLSPLEIGVAKFRTWVARGG
jgi:phenylpropionate dioxygenase-like ring-hydroxylating dioxygenase large terminal subunit